MTKPRNLTKSKFTKRQLEIIGEWEAHTDWEFMLPEKGESFYAALMRNRSWLEQHTTEALSIGNDID